MDEYERRRGDPEQRAMDRRTADDVHELRIDNAVIKSQMDEIKKTLITLVTRVEFQNVKLLTYGCAAMILSAVMAAILSKVIH